MVCRHNQFYARVCSDIILGDMNLGQTDPSAGATDTGAAGETDDQLIEKYKSSPVYLHLAKTQLGRPAGALQTFAYGFNAGGRPDGLWFARGSLWLQKARELDNPKFPLCCNVYGVDISRSKILRLGASNFAAFDAETPDYWLNMDYFALDFVDNVTGEHVVKAKRATVNSDQLRRRPGANIYQVLIDNNIIFDNIDAARAHCEFYTRVDPVRYKYKNWAHVARRYAGIIFEDLSIMPNYLWCQSLDVASGCVWDPRTVRLTHLYARGDGWISVK